MDIKTINFKGYIVSVKEDADNYYVDFRAGAGEGIYSKSDWTLEAALEDQLNLDDESE